MKNVPTAALAVLLTASALAGCGGDSGDSSSATSKASGSGTSGSTAGTSSSSGGTTTLTVFAAASLNKTFNILGTQFEKAHPGVTLKFDFAGSSDLAEQLNEGAPADVFASADEKNMKKVTDAKGMSGTPAIFVRNKLTIVVPKGNPAKVTSFDSLSRSGVQVVVCAPQVPCGSATEKLEKNAGVKLKPVSEESKVTDVLAKVSSGDADAGLVYVTDAKGADQSKVQTIAIPDKINAINKYPIGVTSSSKHADLAKEFVDLVRSAEGTKVLQAAGFLPPS